MADWAEEAAEQLNLVAQQGAERKKWSLHAAKIITKRGEFVFRQLYADTRGEVEAFNEKLRSNSEDRLRCGAPVRMAFWVRRRFHPTVGLKVTLDTEGQFIEFTCGRRINHEHSEETRAEKFDLVVDDSGQVCVSWKGEIIDPKDAAEIILAPLMCPDLRMSKWFLPLSKE